MCFLYSYYFDLMLFYFDFYVLLEQMCGDNNEAKGVILLCDSCDAEYHLSCCTPPLSACPDGEWFCLTCRLNRGEDVSEWYNEVMRRGEGGRVVASVATTVFTYWCWCWLLFFGVLQRMRSPQCLGVSR